jgi:hypothetical protein
MNIPRPILILLIFLLFACGFMFGVGVMQTHYERQAVKHGAAHYELNPETGQSTWMWNK